MLLRVQVGNRSLFFTIYFSMPGLALFLGMLQTMEDQDTLEKVDQGSEMHYMFGYVSDHLYTQKKLFLFYIHNTPQFESEC